MSNYSAINVDKLREELQKEKEKILKRIPQLPHCTENFTGSVELAGLRPIQVAQIHCFVSKLKSINQSGDSLKNHNSETCSEINMTQDEIDDIEKEIQETKVIAEQKRDELENNRTESTNLQHSVDEFKRRVEAKQTSIEKKKKRLFKKSESIQQNLDQISVKSTKLKEVEEELEKNMEFLKSLKKDNEKLADEQRKAEEAVQIAGSITSEATTVELEKHVEQFGRKLQRIKNKYNRLSSSLAEEKAKCTKLESELKSLEQTHHQKVATLVRYVNISKVREQLLISMDTIAHQIGGSSNMMSTESITEAVEYFRKLQLPFKERREGKRRRDNTDSPLESSKRFKKATPNATTISATDSANIPSTVGGSFITSVMNEQPQGPAPRVQAHPAAPPVASASVQPSDDILEEGEIRESPEQTHFPQEQIALRTFPINCHQPKVGSVPGYFHRFRRPQRTYPYERPYGMGYGSTRIQNPMSFPNNYRQPPPLPLQRPPDYRWNDERVLPRRQSAPFYPSRILPGHIPYITPPVWERQQCNPTNLGSGLSQRFTTPLPRRQAYETIYGRPNTISIRPPNRPRPPQLPQYLPPHNQRR